MAEFLGFWAQSPAIKYKNGVLRQAADAPDQIGLLTPVLWLSVALLLDPDC